MSGGMSAVVHKGFVTKCKKGVFKSSKRFWLVLTDDGVLTFYASQLVNPANAKKVIRLRDPASQAAVVPPAAVDKRGPWTRGIDAAWRFAVLATKITSLEAESAAECAAWVGHIERMLAPPAASPTMSTPGRAADAWASPRSSSGSTLQAAFSTPRYKKINLTLLPPNC